MKLIRDDFVIEIVSNSLCDKRRITIVNKKRSAGIADLSNHSNIVEQNVSSAVLLNAVSGILAYDLGTCGKFGNDRNIKCCAERIDPGEEFAL